MMRLLTGPIIDTGSGLSRLVRSVWEIVSRPADFARTHLRSRWAQRTTIILAMQTDDTKLRFRFGRSLFTLFRRGLVSHPDPESGHPSAIEVSRKVTRRFAEKIGGIPAGSINESLLGIPMTAHILGGCPFGTTAADGVVGLDCQVHEYPGAVCHRRVHRAGQPGRQPEPDHHGAGGVRHEPGAGEAGRRGARADRSRRELEEAPT